MEGEGLAPSPSVVPRRAPESRMTRPIATVTMTLSAVVLTAVVVVWATSGGAEARADLVGDPVTTTTIAPAPAEVVTPPPPAPPPVPAADPPDVPVRISIPSLDVDDAVIPVGIEPDGAMEVPPAELAGWYRHGTAPGSDRGSAVIAAHVDYEDRPGVFLDLARVEVGDEVVVEDASGVERSYAVVERWQVDKELLPVDELFRRDGDHVLTLITCGGAFDASARSYDDNIVVRAVPA